MCSMGAGAEDRPPLSGRGATRRRLLTPQLASVSDALIRTRSRPRCRRPTPVPGLSPEQ
jgi:hypothetical protein